MADLQPRISPAAKTQKRLHPVEGIVIPDMTPDQARQGIKSEYLYNIMKYASENLAAGVNFVSLGLPEEFMEPFSHGGHLAFIKYNKNGKTKDGTHFSKNPVITLAPVQIKGDRVFTTTGSVLLSLETADSVIPEECLTPVQYAPFKECFPLARYINHIHEILRTTGTLTTKQVAKIFDYLEGLRLTKQKRTSKNGVSFFGLATTIARWVLQDDGSWTQIKVTFYVYLACHNMTRCHAYSGFVEIMSIRTAQLLLDDVEEAKQLMITLIPVRECSVKGQGAKKKRTRGEGRPTNEEQESSGDTVYEISIRDSSTGYFPTFLKTLEHLSDDEHREALETNPDAEKRFQTVKKEPTGLQKQAEIVSKVWNMRTHPYLLLTELAYFESEDENMIQKIVSCLAETIMKILMGANTISEYASKETDEQIKGSIVYSKWDGLQTEEKTVILTLLKALKFVGTAIARDSLFVSFVATHKEDTVLGDVVEHLVGEMGIYDFIYDKVITIANREQYPDSLAKSMVYTFVHYFIEALYSENSATNAWANTMESAKTTHWDLCVQDKLVNPVFKTRDQLLNLYHDNSGKESKDMQVGSSVRDWVDKNLYRLSSWPVTLIFDRSQFVTGVIFESEGPSEGTLQFKRPVFPEWDTRFFSHEEEKNRWNLKPQTKSTDEGMQFITEFLTRTWEDFYEKVIATQSFDDNTKNYFLCVKKKFKQLRYDVAHIASQFISPSPNTFWGMVPSTVADLIYSETDSFAAHYKEGDDQVPNLSRFMRLLGGLVEVQDAIQMTGTEENEAFGVMYIMSVALWTRKSIKDTTCEMSRIAPFEIEEDGSMRINPKYLTGFENTDEDPPSCEIPESALEGWNAVMRNTPGFDEAE